MTDSEDKENQIDETSPQQKHLGRRSGKDRRKLDIYRYLDEDEIASLRPNRRENYRRERKPYDDKKKGSIEIEHISMETTICPFDRTKRDQ